MNPQIRDKFYDEFIKEPTRDNFLRFINSNCGEMDELDFKSTWIDGPTLAKIMLAMGNSMGGIILIGVKEDNNSNTIELCGIDKLKDKADINNSISKYIPSELAYTVYDFVYDDSTVYPNATGKKFQMVHIFRSPRNVPFISMGTSGGKIESGVIYIRRGTKCEKITSKELEQLLELRLSSIADETESTLSLQQHLEQLKILYNELPKKVRRLVRKGDPSPLATALLQFQNALPQYNNDEYEEIDNPEYPNESYEQFITKLIEKKKVRIERITIV